MYLLLSEYECNDNANSRSFSGPQRHKGCFVETGWAAKDIAAHGDEAHFVGEDILAVAKWILDNIKK